ncbi:unnamed protein product [Ectocarpus sp. 8 AP-2014]
MALAKGQSLASLQKKKGAVPGTAAADKPGPVITLAGGDWMAPAAATAVPQGQVSAAAASRGGVAGVSPPPTATANPSGGGSTPPSLAARLRGGKCLTYLQQRAEPVCYSPFYSSNQQESCLLLS